MGSNSDYMAVGTRIDWRVLQFGAVYSRQHNGDVAFVASSERANHSDRIRRRRC